MITRAPRAYVRDVHNASITDQALGIAVTASSVLPVCAGVRHKQYRCEACGQSFETYRGLKSHRTKQHKYRHPPTIRASVSGRYAACFK